MSSERNMPQTIGLVVFYTSQNLVNFGPQTAKMGLEFLTTHRKFCVARRCTRCKHSATH